MDCTCARRTEAPGHPRTPPSDPTHRACTSAESGRRRYGAASRGQTAIVLQADIVQYLLVLAPLGLPPHVQVEKHPGVEQPLEVLTRGDPDALDPLSPA